MDLIAQRMAFKSLSERMSYKRRPNSESNEKWMKNAKQIYEANAISLFTIIRQTQRITKTHDDVPLLVLMQSINKKLFGARLIGEM